MPSVQISSESMRFLFGVYHKTPIFFNQTVYERDWDVLILLM
jgi:hypothetical protein